MELEIAGEPVLAAAGQTVLFDCREPYRYAASDGLEFIWLLFNGLNSRAFYRRILQARGGRHAFAPPAYSEILRLLDSLLSGCASGERLSEAAVVTAAAPAALPAAARRGRPRAGRTRTYRRGYPFYESAFVRTAGSAGRVAEAVSLSPSHFSRQFKAHTGYSPYEYIVLRRIDKAKYMLTSTQLVGERNRVQRPATTARRISFTASARTLALHPESFGSIRSNRLTSAKNADKIKQSSSRSA